MVDFDALEAAGVKKARERAGLIEYLDSLGFSFEELVEAESSGRLFGLAGDALVSSGRPIHNLKTAAQALGIPAEEMTRVWTLLGLSAADSDRPLLSKNDVDALAIWVQMKVSFGHERAFGFLRVLGATMARLAEAESAVVRAVAPDIQINHSRDELTTARAYRATAELIPLIGRLVDVVHRHHMIGARMYFERVVRDSSSNVVCGVGFADLSGFTALTQLLTPAELSIVLNEFIATVSDVVHGDGGRIVKFIGDEVMWVSSTPETLARAAIDLVNHPRAREEGLFVRAGLGYGSALAINGDYFGNMVNLAARLVAAARPGQVLAAQAVRDELPDWNATACEPLRLKGFDALVTAYELHGS